MLSQADYNVADAIRFFNKYSVEASYLAPTGVGLKKSIMDATGPLRVYLKQKGIHNYEGQLQGPEGKKKIETFFITEFALIPTSASLYRPKAKGKEGDPRIWFSKLPSYAAPNNLIAVLALNRHLYVVNLSRPEILKSAAIPGSPLHKLLKNVGQSTSAIAEELLEKLRKIARRGWIPTVTAGDTGIGATMEHCLGIKTNSSKAPDYKGIEVKTRRLKKFGSPNRSNLFAQVADWKLSTLKSSAEILDTYGYIRGGMKRLNCTVEVGVPNSQGLFLKVMELNDELHECAQSGEIVQDVAVWRFDLLRNRLLTKHNETFWIAGSASKIGGIEHFQYKRVKHTRLPFASNFHTLCQERIITMDHLIKRDPIKGVKEKGPLFKIKPDNLSLLFPPPLEYELL